MKSALGDLIKGLPYRGWVPSKLELVDSYELPKVRYAVLSPVTPAHPQATSYTLPLSFFGISNVPGESLVYLETE